MIINEIGGICFTGTPEEKKKAEEVLRTLLQDKEEESRDIVFALLSTIEHPDPETAVALQEFKIDPANKGIIEKMRPQIARFNKLYK